VNAHAIRYYGDRAYLDRGGSRKAWPFNHARMIARINFASALRERDLILDFVERPTSRFFLTAARSHFQTLLYLARVKSRGSRGVKSRWRKLRTHAKLILRKFVDPTSRLFSRYRALFPLSRAPKTCHTPCLLRKYESAIPSSLLDSQISHVVA